MNLLTFDIFLWQTWILRRFHYFTDKPTDRTKKQSEMRRCMTTVCVCVCMLTIEVCIRDHYIDECVWTHLCIMRIVKNTSIALEKENRMLNKDNNDICLWNILDLYNRHTSRHKYIYVCFPVAFSTGHLILCNVECLRGLCLSMEWNDYQTKQASNLEWHEQILIYKYSFCFHKYVFLFQFQRPKFRLCTNNIQKNDE